jgi:hypothetical protein
MSRSLLWKMLVLVVFAFAATVVFFWIRYGSLTEAGASMDRLLSRTGGEVAEGTAAVVDSTGEAIDRATDGDDST